ncbi:MAG: 30S ribosomal protein S6 [Candidatus Omnitrophica bacterium]|nr:30S ribosomal protein S6 [Candidatus Omnitrophota bacterium]
MNKYEALFIIKPDLGEEDKKTLFNQISDCIVKNEGQVTSASIWAERKKLFFPLKRYKEGTYYLVNFNSPGSSLSKINNIYKMNESILRNLIVALE